MLTISAILLAVVLGAALPARAGQAVDLELLLAVDVSSSVDRSEFDLQMRGLADAFRHPDVVAAIGATGDDGIAVAVMLWSDYAWQDLAVRWTLVRGAADAGRLADAIGGAERSISGGSTAVSSAISIGMEELTRNAFAGRRLVIDISGDGRSDFIEATEAARDRTVALGIVINGLPILNDDTELDRFYRDSVVGGAGAFVLPAADYQAFATAIVAKLIREISRAPVAEAGPGADALALKAQNGSPKLN